MGKVADDHDRHDARSHVSQRQPRIVAPPILRAQHIPAAVLPQHADKFFFINHQNRQNSAELNKYFKYAGPRPRKSQPVADENHVARRRNRQVFRYPFDDPQDDGNHIVTHRYLLLLLKSNKRFCHYTMPYRRKKEQNKTPQNQQALRRFTHVRGNQSRDITCFGSSIVNLAYLGSPLCSKYNVLPSKLPRQLTIIGHSLLKSFSI